MCQKPARERRAVSDYLKIPELADRLDISEKTARNYVKSGVIPSAFVGGAYRVSEKDLAEYLRQAEVRPGKEQPQFDLERFADAMDEASVDAKAAAKNLARMQPTLSRKVAADQLDEARMGRASLEAVLQDKGYSLESIETHLHHAIALGGVTRDAANVWRGTSWEQEFREVCEEIKSVRKRLSQASKEKLEEERESLDPGKIVSLERRQQELEQRAEHEEDAALA
jgi:excisionase family DNA binding protein